MFNYADGTIYQIGVDQEEWTCFDYEDAVSFNGGGAFNAQYGGVGHDGENIWVAGYQQANIRIYADGVAETRWITLDPEEGSLNPDAEIDIDVIFDATGLFSFDYQADIVFISNDPINPRVTVTVTLSVTGVPLFDIEFEPILNPFENAEDLVFPDTYLAGSTDMVVGVKNGGTEALEIDGFEIDGTDAESFSTDWEEIVLDPDEEYEFTVTFAPEALREDGGMHECTFHMYSNAMNEDLEDNGHVWWNLFGQAQVPPSVYITGNDLEETSEDQWFIHQDILLGDDPINVSFIIGNEEGEGRDNLDWSIDFEEVEQERDANSRSLRGANGAGAPRRDPGEPGDLLGSFNGINQNGAYCSAGGWDTDNEVMWVTNSNNLVAAYSFDDNYENFEEVFSFRTNEWTIFNTWAQGVIYTTADWRGVINRWDQEGNQLDQYQINFSNLDISGDSENGWFFIMQADNFTIHVFDLDGEGGIGNEIGAIANVPGLHNNNTTAGFVWVPEHIGNGGPLWYNVAGAGVYQVDVDLDEWACVENEDAKHFNARLDNYYDGVGHDANNIWAAGNQQGDIRIYDDGVAEIRWIAFEPDEGTVAAGEEQEVTITFNTEGMEENFVSYAADAFIYTNDPQHEVIVIRCELSIGTRLQQYFEFAETNRVHNITIEYLSFLGETVPIGWEIGIFTEDDVLAGAIVWRDDAVTVLPAYGTSGALAGFTNGEPYSFKVYDPAEQAEYDWVRIEISEGPAVWLNNNATTLTLAALPVIEQTIHFVQGWNLISLNIIPIDDFWIVEEGPDPFLMCSPAFYDENEEIWSMIQMKDEAGDFCSPEWDFWGIEVWNLSEGYQFNIDGDREVSWFGAPIGAQADLLGLDAGWNIMAYYPDYNLPCEFIDYDEENNFYVIKEIADRVIIAKDANGDFCVPDWDFSSMSDWEAGQGYQINISEDIDVFNYPVELNNRAAMPVRQARSVGESHWTRPVSTGENMSVLVSSIAGLSIGEGDQIAAFNIDGELVGTGTFVNDKCGIAIWGDRTPADAIEEGMLEGEAFELKLWDADRELVVDLSAGAIKVGNGLEYKKNGFVVLDVKVDETLPTEFNLAQNYPNPFNSTTRMAYEVPEPSKVSIQVFDLTGRYVTTLVNGELHAGRYTAIWEARDVTSGIYIVQMKSANFNAVRKVMLVK
jgi:hypothetical protein